MRDTPQTPTAPARRSPVVLRPSGDGSAQSPADLARARLFMVLGEERALTARRLSEPRRPSVRFGVRPPAPASTAPASTGPTSTGPTSIGPAGWRSRLRGLSSSILGTGPRARRGRVLGRRLARLLRLPLQMGVASGVAYLVLFNFSVVRGSSMAPGIHDGDRILVDQVSYLFRDVERGDVVVMRCPVDPNVDYIKRIVGLPGDTVLIRGTQVFVNGELLQEPYVAEGDARSYLSTVVGPDHFFVLGDNRPRSADSREFGQVPRAYLRGKVDLRVWPFGRLGLID